MKFILIIIIVLIIFVIVFDRINNSKRNSNREESQGSDPVDSVTGIQNDNGIILRFLFKVLSFFDKQ